MCSHHRDLHESLGTQWRTSWTKFELNLCCDRATEFIKLRNFTENHRCYCFPIVYHNTFRAVLCSRYNYVYGNKFFFHACAEHAKNASSPSVLVRDKTHIVAHPRRAAGKRSPCAYLSGARAPCLLNPFTASWQNDYINPEKLPTRCKKLNFW